jgi:Protein of unknown function (DUF2785)
MTTTSVAAVALSGLFAGAVAVAQPCPPADFPREQLLELKTHEFSMADGTRRQTVALDLLPCLGSVDPVLRDGVAFEALASWMRARQLSDQTVGLIFERLLPQLAPNYPDPAGVQRPFAALVLAEVARFDRVDAFMTQQQRHQLVAAGTLFLMSVRDYRGFDEREGWRHSVAHGSDLMLQLAINPHTSKADLEQMLSAVATQISPLGEHYYVHGESERLAEAAFYIARRKLQSREEWRSWFERVSAPAPFPDWRVAFNSQAGLAKRHNTAAFLEALYFQVREEGPDVQDLLLPPLRRAIKQLQ